MTGQPIDLDALAVKGRAVIDGNRFMTLATADAAGAPWGSPVFYVADGYSTFYWISSQEATQVRNIAARPEVGIVVFNSQQEPGDDEVVYLAATAVELSGQDRERGVDTYLGATTFGKGRDAFHGESRYRIYRATVTEHSMLCPLASGTPCPVHGRTSDHRVVVPL